MELFALGTYAVNCFLEAMCITDRRIHWALGILFGIFMSM
jgi:hypothetical protein